MVLTNSIILSLSTLGLLKSINSLSSQLDFQFNNNIDYESLLISKNPDLEEDNSDDFMAESLAEAEKEVAQNHGKPMDIKAEIKSLEK